jgi:curved DNA-binding protein CbpA
MRRLIFATLAVSIFTQTAMATWSKPARDLYSVLGVAKNASEDDIKKAVRRLRRQYHPDVNSGPAAKASEAKLLEVNQAYQVLSDPSHRAVYDNYGGFDLSPQVPPGSARPPSQQAPPPPEPPPQPAKEDWRAKIRDYAKRPLSEGGVGLNDDQVDAFIARFAKEYGSPGRTLDQAMAMHFEDLKASYRAYFDFAKLSKSQGGLGETEERAKQKAIEAAQKYSKQDIATGIKKYKATARFNSLAQSATGTRLNADQLEDAKKAFAILTRPAAEAGFGMSDETAFKIAAEAAKYPKGGDWEAQLAPLRERYRQAAELYDLNRLPGVESSELADLAIRDPALFDKKFQLYKRAIDYAASSSAAGGLDLSGQPAKVDEFVRGMMASGSPEEYLSSHRVTFQAARLKGKPYAEAVELAQAATAGSCSLAYAKLSRLFK